MNQFNLVLFLFSILILSACGQYGDLYAPEQDATVEEKQSAQQQTDSSLAKENQVEQDQ